ncbi:MAG: TIM-barrel domain-containing protein [Thermoguttaceae bacterium]
MRLWLIVAMFIPTAWAMAAKPSTEPQDRVAAERNRPASPQMDEVAPGVWHIRLGQPERMAPTRFQEAPSRQQAIKTLGPAPRPPFAAAQIGVKTTERGLALELPLDSGEQVYGLGMNLKTFRLTKSKKTVRVSDDQTTLLGDSHAPAPFYVSTRGYGVYVDTARYASFYFGNLDAVRDATPAAGAASMGAAEAYRPHARSGRFVGVDVPSARGVDLYLFAGPDMRRAVQRYNLFSGGGCLPPLWSLGVWYRNDAGQNQKEAADFLRQFRQRRIPCDVFGLEPGWHSHAYSCSFAWSDKYPKPDELIREAAELGYKLNLWEHAFTHPTSPIHQALLPWSGDYRVWGGLVPDFATPEGRRIFSRYHAKTFAEKGISGFKLDECDHQPLSATPWSFPEQTAFPSGLDGEQMHLLFGPLYQRTIAGIYRERNQRTLGLVRASGPLAAPLPFALYSDAYDHRDYVRAIATSGFAGVLWCPEIREAGSPEELYRRLETGVFSAVTQINCWYLKNPPWMQVDKDLNNAGKFRKDWPEVEGVCRKVLQLRMRLLPYLYSAYADYRETGLPPTRALVMDFPEDEAARTIDDQYMFGRSLMVAPLWTGQKKRQVYLPQGDWYDFWTNERLAGGRKIEVEKPLDQIPVFVRANTLLPLAEPVDFVTPQTRFDLSVRVFGSKPEEFTLVEDDGVSLDFEKGGQNRITLGWDGHRGAQTMTGGYRGPSRYRIIRWDAF